MVARKLLVVALAATLLIGGVAATGAASVQDAQPTNDTQDDRTPGDAGPPDDSTQYEGGGDASEAGNGSAADRGNSSAADRGNGSAPADGEQGPPTDMPANVPDHVTQIHETINGFLNGEVDDLGNALSELLGGEDAGDASEVNESDDADEAADEAADADEESEDADDADDADEADDADDSDDEDTDA